MNNPNSVQPQRQIYFSRVRTFPGLSKTSPLLVFQALHWGEGAVLTVHRKVKSNWQDLGAIHASELHTKWPIVSTHLSHDSYFSINSTYEQRRSFGFSSLSNLPIYSRKAERLRWLNAVILDVDIYNTQGRLGFNEMLDVFVTEIGRNDLPWPSFICSSGRGLWGLWLLRDHANQTPVPAFRERREIYQRVNKELVRRFAHLGADPAAVDPSRVMRIPGSINTDAAPECNVVQFFRLSNEAHTLPGLAALLGVRGRKVRLPEESVVPKNEAKVLAGRTRWSIPLDGFRRLWNIRGHFGRGMRSFATYVYAVLLRRNRIHEREIYAECLRLADSCRPILTTGDVERCVSSSLKSVSGDWKRSISNAAIARMLKITPAEKAMLRPWFKPERQKKGNQVAARRSLIMRELQQAGCWNSNRLDWIPTRDMTRLLFDRHGVAARTGNPLSHVTVAKDYRQLYQRHFAQSPSVNFSPLAAPSLTHSLCTSNKKLTATRSPRGILQDSAGSRSKHRPRMSACARAPCDQADTHLLRTCLPNLSAEESWSDHGPETREGMQVSGQVATFRKPEIEQPTTEAIEIIDAEELAARLKLPKSRILEGTRSRSVDPIPHLKFGRYVRFQWGSRWLTQWLERRAGGRKPE